MTSILSLLLRAFAESVIGDEVLEATPWFNAIDVERGNDGFIGIRLVVASSEDAYSGVMRLLRRLSVICPSASLRIVDCGDYRNAEGYLITGISFDAILKAGKFSLPAEEYTTLMAHAPHKPAPAGPMGL